MQLTVADDIDLMDGSNSELQDLTIRLAEKATAYGMEVRTERKKQEIITSNTSVQIMA